MRVAGISYVQGRNYSKDGSGNPVVTTKFGIAIHNTANDATAEQEADYATRRTDSVSSHFYVDGNSVVQSLDTGWRAWHAASTTGNSNSISVEITGVNGWTRQQWLDRVAWDELGRVLAAVIRHHWPDGSFQVRRASVTEMGDNPRVKAFYGHYDMTRAWGGDHTDPGPNFPWDRLFDAVNAAMEDDMALSADDLSGVRTQVALGIYDALHVAATGSDYRGLTYSGQGSIGAAIRANLGALTSSASADVLAEVRAQGEQTRAAMAGAKDAILAALPEGDEPVSRDDLVAALTAVLGSVDGATPVE